MTYSFAVFKAKCIEEELLKATTSRGLLFVNNTNVDVVFGALEQPVGLEPGQVLQEDSVGGLYFVERLGGTPEIGMCLHRSLAKRRA